MKRPDRAHEEAGRDIVAFLQRVREWAKGESQIRAITLVGSHARGNASASSDIDIILLVEDPERFIQDQAWAATFGTVIRSRVEDWGRVQSLRVWYDDGAEVEFGVTDPDWGADPDDHATRGVIEAGHQVVYVRR